MDKIEKVLTHGVASVLPDKNSLKELMVRNKIKVYAGFDPTGPKLHLGHSILLRKLQQFSDLGHEVVLLFGTGTVLAGGDPSQRKEGRELITIEKIEENVKDWKRQASKIIDFDKVRIKQNGEWLLKLGFSQIIKIASYISATQLFKRDMFQERIKREDTIWSHEILYPILQGYDSVYLDVDLEMGGTDQTFNMLIGRELQKKMNNREKYVLTTNMISGTDGKQMSKSSGNCVWLDDSPEEMTRKILSLADSQIEEYWVNLTNFLKTDLERISPQNAKQQLALEIVKTYHGPKSSEKSATSAKLLTEYAHGQLSQQSFISLPSVTIPQGGTTVLNLGTQYQSLGSVSYVKDLVKQGAVDIDYQKVTGTNQIVRGDQLVRFGKKVIFKTEEEK